MHEKMYLQWPQDNSGDFRGCRRQRGLYGNLRGGSDGKRRPFYEKPLCVVRKRSFNGDTQSRPTVEANEEDPLPIIFRLVKSGYGSVSELMEMPARTIMQALHYENFCSDYESEYMELNK